MATKPKMIWKKIPITSASKYPTIWLVEMLLAKIPMLM